MLLEHNTKQWDATQCDPPRTEPGPVESESSTPTIGHCEKNKHDWSNLD